MELQLGLERRSPQETRRAVRAGFLSVLFHLTVIGILAVLPPLPGPTPHERAAVLYSTMPLIAPPAELTQKEPNRGRPSREVDLESLLPRPRIQVPPLPPSPARPVVPPPPPAPLPEPPRIEAQAPRLAPPPPPGLEPPPVRIQPEETKPKLAFETPGRPGGSGTQPPRGTGRLAPPSASVEEAARVVARGGGGGLMVSDFGGSPGGVGEALNLPPSPGRTGSALELLSDPMGVDFRPYLIRILSSVKRNWLAVIPESAKMGRRGKVQIQFAIARDGRVPKLVIALPSGADALDRAAVAGISATNPFPPLPLEFRGEQIRLQFTFLYNLPAN